MRPRANTREIGEQRSVAHPAFEVPEQIGVRRVGVVHNRGWRTRLVRNEEVDLEAT
jgi:hypothetical protein